MDKIELRKASTKVQCYLTAIPAIILKGKPQYVSPDNTISKGRTTAYAMYVRKECEVWDRNECNSYSSH